MSSRLASLLLSLQLPNALLINPERIVCGINENRLVRDALDSRAIIAGASTDTTGSGAMFLELD
jgi:hypothetical protein